MYWCWQVKDGWNCHQRRITFHNCQKSLRRVSVAQRYALTLHQGPNLQNFVKCTYENVTRELRIVS